MTILSMKIKEVVTVEVTGRNIIVESGKMVRDLTETIESGPEVILETGGKQIDSEEVHGRENKQIGLENKGFPYTNIMNIFLFIMEIFNRDV